MKGCFREDLCARLNYGGFSWANTNSSADVPLSNGASTGAAGCSIRVNSWSLKKAQLPQQAMTKRKVLADYTRGKTIKELTSAGESPLRGNRKTRALAPGQDR